jgi:hypothetical protein
LIGKLGNDSHGDPGVLLPQLLPAYLGKKRRAVAE